ncbi:MAG: 50S ribosomal protein L1, partial [Anaerolineae bacterium]
NVHTPFGKASFSEDQLMDNLQTILDAIKRARPAATKGIYVRRIVMANTMGPGIHLDPSEAMAE